MNLFEEIREKVPIFEAAQYYGLNPNQKGKYTSCLCCFHSDNNPSMVIYPNAFHCFTCGAHVDVTGLVAKLFSLSNYEAAKKIITDFRLNINIGGKVTERQSHGNIKSAESSVSFSESDIAYGFKLWRKEAFIKYCDRYKAIKKRLEKWKCPEDIKPEDEELFATLVLLQGELDWITDVLIYGNEENVLDLMKILKTTEVEK